jgi:integrase/recombinase XerD
MARVIQEMRLFSQEGEALYLNADERKRFLGEVRKDTNRDAVIFCTLLHYTGARPTELRELTVDRVHPDTCEIVLRSIKKRKKDRKGNIKLPQYRTIPVPESVMNLVTLAMDIRAKQKRGQRSFLWPSANNLNTPIDAKSVYRWVKHNMDAAGVKGKKATSKGLRHGFAVAMVTNSVPLTQIKTWMGHTSIQTTEIYLSVCGEEAYEMMRKAWANE